MLRQEAFWQPPLRSAGDFVPRRRNAAEEHKVFEKNEPVVTVLGLKKARAYFGSKHKWYHRIW